jgi:hypothetical protein
MTPAEVEALLQAAFAACDAAGRSLDTQQREIIFRILISRLTAGPLASDSSASGDSSSNRSTAATASTAFESANVTRALNTSGNNRVNPLDALTPDQRQVLLQFIQEQKRQNRSWKAQLLNDWLYERSSSVLEFVRQQYGLVWLEQIQPEDIAAYADETTMLLKVGDRIEISNGLWEWVQENGPCQREWFPCTIVQVVEVSDGSGSPGTGYSRQTNCIIRFDNGMEYEIQGVYEWNRYNWRWARH